MTNIIGKFPVLLPDIPKEDKEGWKKWAVIACDQYTTQRKYWEKLSDDVGDAPSTLRLIVPEVYLKDDDLPNRIDRVDATMKSYLQSGVFTQKDCAVLVERTLTDGQKRIGLNVAIDLDAYDFRIADVPIRATEKTVLERLPVRVTVREKADIELPHILILIDDRINEAIDPIYNRRDRLNRLYDFELNSQGGHIVGYEVPFGSPDFARFSDWVSAKEKVRNGKPVLAVGDGNHSMAAAKEHWERIKKGLTAEERAVHPARFILAEIVNLYQDSMDFYPIHRAVTHCRPKELLQSLSARLHGEERLKVLMNGREQWISRPLSASETIRVVQECISDYADKEKTVIEYVHSPKRVEELSKESDCLGIILPTFDKKELFDYVSTRGNLPQKAFSIGTEDNKKFYLEAKRITL